MKRKHAAFHLFFGLVLVVSLGACSAAKGKTIESAYTFEYGSTIDLSSLTNLVPAEYGQVIAYPSIDTKKMGSSTYTIKTEKKKVAMNVIITDTQAPVFTGTEAATIALNASFDANQGVSAADPVDGAVQFTVEGTVNSAVAGTYTLTYTATDKNGLKTLVTRQIQVGHVMTQVDGRTYFDGVLIVNKTYGLPSTYNPGLDPTTAASFGTMQAAARADGINLWIVSGFRSYSYQVNLYQSYVNQDGQEATDRVSARPGFSEHQSGLCLDLNSTDDSFAGTPEALWIAAHAHEYGFVVRFPEGKEDKTGYSYEPWHIRYVGTDLAAVLYQQNLSLEEYFGITSKYGA